MNKAKREDNARKKAIILEMPLEALFGFIDSLPTCDKLSEYGWKGEYNGAELQFADLVYLLHHHPRKDGIPDKYPELVACRYRRNHAELYREAVYGNEDPEDEYDLWRRFHAAEMELEHGRGMSRLYRDVVAELLDENFGADIPLSAAAETEAIPA